MTSKVTNWKIWFHDAYVFNQDIGRWNTVESDEHGYMFAYASAFNQDIGSWNTEKVTNMGGMFVYASAFNQDLSGVGNVGKDGHVRNV